MKKVISLLVVLITIIGFSTTTSAQQRTKVADGIFLVSYGNITVIENDNTQQTVRIKVQEKEDSLYDIVCGDTIVKTVAKSGLKAGIAYAIQTYTTIPSWVSAAAVGWVVDKVYDGACDYFR